MPMSELFTGRGEFHMHDKSAPLGDKVHGNTNGDTHMSEGLNLGKANGPHMGGKDSLKLKSNMKIEGSKVGAAGKGPTSLPQHAGKALSGYKIGSVKANNKGGK